MSPMHTWERSVETTVGVTARETPAVFIVPPGSGLGP